MAEVYALYSARDGKVRYVGRTSGTRDARFRRHQRVGEGRFVSKVWDWLHEEWKAGFPVEHALLQMCNDETSDEIETEWINKFPNLLNELKYNFRGGKPPVIPEIREYMRDHMFNVGGFRGIHWWRQIDRYAVFIYDGRGPDWLDGDGAPGRDWGDFWFSDRTEAWKARDKHRQRQKYKNWLPDIEQELEWPLGTLGTVAPGIARA